MTTRRPALWLALILTLPGVASAENAYVIDRVEVGLYESASFDSPILKLLPTGTELEILSRQGDLAQVREPDGLTGWIDTQYLMEAKPTRQLLNEARAEVAQLRNELETARREVATVADTDVIAKVEQLEQIRENLEAQLTAERQRITDLKKELATLHREAAEVPDNDNVAGVADSQGLANSIGQVTGDRALQILLGIVFLLGLSVGIYLLDLHNRRRHGGFRV